METHLNNRGNGPKRGRPPKESAPAPAPLEAVQVAVTGVRCPCCGRGMVPKRINAPTGQDYQRCTLCGGRFRRWQESGQEFVAPLPRL